MSMVYEIGQASRIGHRKINQDRLAVVETDNAVLLVVADGLGGHKGGEIAAQITADVFFEKFTATSFPVEDPIAFLKETTREAHKEIVVDGRRQNPPIAPRTTVVACLIQMGTATWVHVGDSRLYLFRHGLAVFRTKDHSYVEQLVQQGLLEEGEMAKHPKRHHITRCLGGNDKAPGLTLGSEPKLREGDVLILCSDGLWDPLGDKGISDIFADLDVGTAVPSMAEHAEKVNKNSDNITVVGFRYISGPSEVEVEVAMGALQGAQEAAGSIQTHDPEKADLDQAILDIKNAINQFKTEKGI